MNVLWYQTITTTKQNITKSCAYLKAFLILVQYTIPGVADAVSFTVTTEKVMIF